MDLEKLEAFTLKDITDTVVYEESYLAAEKQFSWLVEYDLESDSLIFHESVYSLQDTIKIKLFNSNEKILSEIFVNHDIVNSTDIRLWILDLESLEYNYATLEKIDKSIKLPAEILDASVIAITYYNGNSFIPAGGVVINR